MGTEPAPTGQGATADLVEVLRQRVQHADELLNTASASTGNIMDALETALEALARATGKAYSASDPAVQAVARALLGEGVAYTEWCVYWGEDPNACSEGQQRKFPDLGLLTYDEREEAESTRQAAESGGIASRQVTVYRTPWQVVDTEGDS